MERPRRAVLLLLARCFYAWQVKYGSIFICDLWNFHESVQALNLVLSYQALIASCQAVRVAAVQDMKQTLVTLIYANRMECGRLDWHERAKANYSNPFYVK